MPDDTQLVAVRQQQIADLINKNESAKLGELRTSFGVSEATIRRDLAALEAKGMIMRTHGGAVANLLVSQVLPNENRAVSNVEEKTRIARAASKLIKGAETVFLDAGTTALQIAREAHQNTKCHYVTSSLGVANELRMRCVPHFFVIGGSYLEVNDSFTGSMAISTIRSLSFDISFLCVSSVDIDRQQVSIGIDAYCQVQKEVIRASRKNYVVTDHTKFRAGAFVSTASFEQLDGVVTTDLVDQIAIQRMRAANLDVILA